jgi:hypothetical protein
VQSELSYLDGKGAKVAVILDIFREFQETTSYLNHFAREETVLAGLRFKKKCSYWYGKVGAARTLVSIDGALFAASGRGLNMRWSLGICGRNLILRLL